MREAEIHYDQCSWAKTLLSMMEDFISTESPGHFARTVKDGGTVFILQLSSNAHSSYLMISELLHGRWKGFIVVPEGKLGSGWRGFGFHLRKAAAPPETQPPKNLSGIEHKASKSFVKDQRVESKTHPKHTGWQRQTMAVEEMSHNGICLY